MSGKSRNPSKSCKACGAPVKANVRYCVACAIQRKAARVGIDPRKVHVGVVRPPCTTADALGLGGIYRTPPEALAVVEKEIATDIVTMNPPLTMGGYLGDLLPVMKGGAK